MENMQTHTKNINTLFPPSRPQKNLWEKVYYVERPQNCCFFDPVFFCAKVGRVTKWLCRPKKIEKYPWKMGWKCARHSRIHQVLLTNTTGAFQHGFPFYHVRTLSPFFFWWYHKWLRCLFVWISCRIVPVDSIWIPLQYSSILLKALFSFAGGAYQCMSDEDAERPAFFRNSSSN